MMGKRESKSETEKMKEKRREGREERGDQKRILLKYIKITIKKQTKIVNNKWQKLQNHPLT